MQKNLLSSTIGMQTQLTTKGLQIMNISKADPATSGRRWFSSTRIKVFVGLLLLSGVGLIFLAQSKVGQLLWTLANAGKPSYKFNQEVQRLKDEGEPTSFDDLWLEPLPDSENASFHYLEAVWLLVDPADPEYDRKHKLHYATEISKRLGKPDLCVAREGIDQLVLDTLDRAASSQQSKPLTKSERYFLQSYILFSPIKFEQERFSTAFKQQRYEDATEIALRQLHFVPILGNELGEGPDLRAYRTASLVIENLNRVIRTSKLSDDLLDRIDAKLTRHDASPYLTRKAKEARIEYIEEIRAKDGVRLNWAFAGQEKMLQIQAHQISLASQPYFQVKDQFYLHTFSNPPSASDINFRDYENTFVFRHARWNYLVSKTRCLRCLIAIEKHKSLHGIEPARIEDLGLPAESLMATIADGPITIEKKADGWWVVWQWDESSDVRSILSLYGERTGNPGCVPVPLDAD